MKCLLFSILLIFLTLPVCGQSESREIDLRLNSIGSGTTDLVILQKLGKPSSRKTGGIVPCSDGSTLLTLRYPGLVIELARDEDEKNFSVFIINVTSPKWVMSCISIGANIEDVKAKFGQPYHISKHPNLQ